MHGKQGFTVIELVVAIALFAIVASLAVGGFTQALRTQRQSAALLSANSNVSLVIEQMMREIRTGSKFCIEQACTDSADYADLTFRNAQDELVTYCFQNNRIERGVGGGICGGSNFQPITADNVRVEYAKFYRSGTVAGDGRQPRVTIALGVSAPEQGVAGNVIRLQTTVSPRLPMDS